MRMLRGGPRDFTSELGAIAPAPVHAGQQSGPLRQPPSHPPTFPGREVGLQPVPRPDRGGLFTGIVQGADEAPAGHDAELGELFRRMREASGLTLVMIAARLDTSPGVIQTFEAGALLAFPDWHETERIVTAYARMVGLDPGVALQRLRTQRTSGAPVVPAQAVARSSLVEARRIAPSQPVASAGMPAPIPSNGRPGVPGRSAMPGRSPLVAPAPSLPAPSQGWIQLPPQPATRPIIDGQARREAVSPAASPPPVAGGLLRSSQPPRADVTAHGARTGSSPHAIAVPEANSAVLSAINPLQPPPRAARPEVEAAQQRLAAEHQPPSTAKAALRRGHPAKIALKYVTAPMCLVAGLWYTVQHPTKVHAALVDLPEPLPRIVKAGMEIVLIGSGTGKDGLSLTVTGDPRSRKSDKLPVRK